MPKAQPHFDILALLTAVQQQDLGLVVSTNDPAGFRRIAYAAMRANEALRCYIYADPESATVFHLLKSALPSRAPVEEPTDA